MGLDVRTYGNIKLAENEEEADFTAYVIDEDWKHKIKNLQEMKIQLFAIIQASSMHFHVSQSL